MTLAKINKHEKDKLVYEHPDYGVNHIYVINDKHHTDLGYESCTTFIGKFFTKFDADSVIEKYYHNWQCNENSQYCGLLPYEIKDMWEENRDRKATKGTYMHLQFELYFNDVDYDKDLQELPEFKKWIDDWNVTAYRTEMTVFSERLEIVGNIDLIYKDDKGRYNICDFKRKMDVKGQFGSNKCKFPFDEYSDCETTKHAIQLSIYKKILEEEYGLKIHKLYNLYIFRDDPYTYREREYIETEPYFTIKCLNS